MAYDVNTDALVKIGSVTLTGDQIPSAIHPSLEIGRNSERALDGTLQVDVMYQKENFDLVWDLLSEKTYNDLMGYFVRDTSLQVEILGKQKTCYVSEVQYTPVIVEGLLFWQNVSVKLAEL